MRIKVGITLLLTVLLSYAYADDTKQGAAAYDWQTCVNKKIGECSTGCQFSHDPDCLTNCKKSAADKCQAEGVSPS